MYYVQFEGSKDHVRENVRRMRQIQRQCKQRENDVQQPVKVLWKSAKFTDVPSRIKDDMQVSKFSTDNNKSINLDLAHKQMVRVIMSVAL